MCQVCSKGEHYSNEEQIVVLLPQGNRRIAQGGFVVAADVRGIFPNNVHG